MKKYNNKFLIGFQKHFCAHSGSLLIDDYDKNINDFRQAGGNAILVPRQWNSMYKEEENLLTYMKIHLGLMKGLG